MKNVILKISSIALIGFFFVNGSIFSQMTNAEISIVNAQYGINIPLR